jgi:hypothetical protein
VTRVARRQLVTGFAALALAGGYACAAEWSATPALGTYSEYTSNPRLSTLDAADSAIGVVGDASLLLAWRDPVFEASLRPRLVLREYRGDDGLDASDVYVDGTFRRSLERGNAEFTAAYADDSTLTGDPAAGGVGGRSVPRQTLDASFAALRQTSELGQFGIRVQYDDVSYEQGLRDGLLDYRYLAGLAYQQHSLDARTRIRVIGRAARLYVPFTDRETYDYSAGLGLDRQWNPVWRSSIAAGPEFSRVAGGSTENGFSYRAELAGVMPRSTWQVEASRVLSPVASRGQLETRNALTFSADFRVRERLGVSALLSLSQFEDPDRPGRPDLDVDDRRYGTAALGISWQASEQCTWQAGYTYLVADETRRAEDHRIRIGASCGVRPWTVSR